MKFCPVCDREFDSGNTCPDDGTVLLWKKTEEQDPRIGTVLKENYRLESKIGEGGMGTVYSATQMPLGRTVAVKVLDVDARDASKQIKRFYREAKLLSALSHPNIVSLIDFGNTEEGVFFFIMEHLHGVELSDLVPERSPLPADEVVAIMQKTCAGVSAAHKNGLIHRDLKPSNIFLAKNSDGSEIVKVLDFGIAKVHNDEGLSRLTQTGSIVGTIGYISPELITGEGQPSEQSDVYSLGGILYFMLTNDNAYDGPSTRSILFKQLTEPPEPLNFDQFGYPASFKEVVLKAMAISPADRYKTVDELAQALTEAAAKPNTSSSTTLPAQQDFLNSDQDTLTLTQPGPEVTGEPTVEFKPPAKKKPAVLKLAAGGAILVAALLAGLYFWQRSGVSHSTPDSSEQPTANTAQNMQEDVDAATLVQELPVRGVQAQNIKLGISGIFSGSNREIGRGVRLGIDTYLRQVNESGGIHGRQISLIALDDGYEPERAKQNTQELIDKHKVFTILGSMGTPTTQLALPLAVEKKVLYFAPFSGAAFLEKDPPDRYVFNYRARYSEEIKAVVNYLVNVKGVAANRIAAFYQDDTFGQGAVTALKRELKEAGHPAPDKLLVVGYERNTVDVATAVKQLRQSRSRIDAIVLVSTYLPAARLVKELKTKRYQPTFVALSVVGSQAFAEELKENSPQAMAGIIVTQTVPLPTSQATGVRRYRDALAKYFPEEQPSFTSLEGYIMANIFAEGLRRAGRKFDTEMLINTFESIKDLDLGTGAVCQFGPSRHQCTSKVWGTVLDDKGVYQALELE